MVLKHSAMTLYSDILNIDSHRTRIALAEKGILVNIKYVDCNEPSEDFLTLNPYNLLPTLVDRDLVLYEAKIITEYLDERFPHPPLLPVYPVARAKCRLMIHRIEQDWLFLVKKIQHGNKGISNQARKDLVEQLLSVASVFNEYSFFLSEDFSLTDCCLAPILWRLKSLEITFPKQAQPIIEYMERVFSRETFKNSLSDLERDLGEQ